MPTLTVNGNEVEFEKGMTVLQACELADAEIPRFCYHERLQIAGNCRMCLVQIEGGPPKPAASCAMPAAEGMKIHTDTPMVKKAREGVMEFLLANHPLDCPICDQGGECDLQDQAMAYGRGNSRFDENKRAVKDKYMGPLIKTHMTRCIQCTRCVRFLDDVGGIEELGAVNRGENMQISTYVEKSLTSELSGNIIDLCPVGALTSKPYAFKARPWELRKTESIDVLDAVGSNIRVDSKGKEVLRFLPRLNEDINEEWLADKSRFAYDGLTLQRLDRPYIRKDGKLSQASWSDALHYAAEKISATSPEKIAAIAGDLADCESMYSLKELCTSLGIAHIDCRQDGALGFADNPMSYRFNTSIAGIEEADFCLLISTNPRHEAPILNARIRKAHLQHGLKIASIGEETDLTYPYEYLGNEPKLLEVIADGSHPLSRRFKEAKKSMIIIGSGILPRSDSDAILASAYTILHNVDAINEQWNGFNVLQRAASRVGGLDLGFVPQKNGKDTTQILKAAENNEMDILFLLGADEIDMNALGNSFVIYQGHHGDAGAHRADIIFPAAAYTEKDATYVNTEGRAQHTRTAIFPPGEAKEDWPIIHELAQALNKPLSFETLEELRQKMATASPAFNAFNQLVKVNTSPIASKKAIKKESFTNPITNYYMTDPISRASSIMGRCTSDIAGITSEEAA